MIDSLLYFIALFLLILLSAMYSSSETAFFVLSKNKKAKEVDQKDSILLLNSILLTNSIILTIFAELNGILLGKIFKPLNFSDHLMSLLTVAITTVVIVIFGESIPKNFGLAFPQVIMKLSRHLLSFTKTLFYPITIPLVYSLSKFLGAFENNQDQDKLSEQEIRSIIKLSYEREIVNPREKRLIDAVVNLYNKQVYLYMIARRDIIVMDFMDSLEDIFYCMQKKSISKVLIQQDNIDNILGYVSVEDITSEILHLRSPLKDFSYLIRPLILISETKRLVDVFRILHQKKSSIALITDEYGGTSGIVTTNFLLKEIFWVKKEAIKDIQSEFLSGDQYVFENHEITVNAFRHNIRAIREIFDIEETWDYDEENIGFFILKFLDRFPYEGEQFVYEGLNFTIDKMRGQSISKVRISRVLENDF